MLYQGDGRMIIAHTPEEHDQLMKDGWDTVPGEVHTRQPASPAPAMSGGDPLAILIRSVMREVLEEYGFKPRRR